ncbi:MAG: sensor histidine kinase, partial [Rhizobiales bacterium]|nr:sensor histidine kinase [Rhizobacter sp.]
EVHLWVADSGVGLSQGAGTGTGLRNLQERLIACFGPGASVSLAGRAPHGVRADIRIPMSVAA